MNDCIDCRYYNFMGICEGAYQRQYSRKNIITGKLFTCAQDPKDMRFCEAYCGTNGRWFERRIDAPPPIVEVGACEEINDILTSISERVDEVGAKISLAITKLNGSDIQGAIAILNDLVK